VTIGLFLIYTGFWGFYVACNVPIIGAADIGAEGVMFTATTIYLTPTTLSGITVNFLMSLSGGLLTGCDLQGRRVLDLLERPRRHHRGLGRQRPLSSDSGHADRLARRGDHL
jgi:hypothetical protein